MREFWTSEEIIFLKKNRKFKTNEEIAKILNRSYSSIVNKSFKLGLQAIKPIVIGQIFSNLTVLKKSNKNGSGGSSYYTCKCKCGTIKDILGVDLKRKLTKSCGCRLAESRRNPPGDISFKNLYCRLKSNSKNRKGDKSKVDITQEQHKIIILQDCHYCGDQPKKYNPYLKKDGTRQGSAQRIHEDTIERATIYVNTVDRVDSNIGYTLSNCVPCCWPCNRLKCDSSKEQFLCQIEKIADFQKKKIK